MGPRDKERERIMTEQVALVTAEARVYEGVKLNSSHAGPVVGDRPTPAEFVEILTPEEKARREAVARAETNATVLSEMSYPADDRRKLEERLRDEQVKTLTAEMAAGKRTVSFGG